jgi:hypothetical protein
MTNSTENLMNAKPTDGIVTRTLADMCHRCSICTLADRRPDSPFGRLMRWHRKWCPAYAAHTRVYGVKPLSR